MARAPKIGLAIGGGAAYGLSAVGVLKVLEENHIPIDFISGTSIGAVIGALYASGMKSFRIEDEILGIEWKELLDFVLPEEGLVSGKKLEEYIRGLIKNKTFEDLDIPLFITAVDINEGKQVIFNKGDVASAVRASISIPGVFMPVEMGKMTLVDGGVLDPIPIEVLEKHADIIIAMDFLRDIKPGSYMRAEKEKSELFRVIQRDFIESEIRYMKEYMKHGKIKMPLIFKWLLSPKSLIKIIKNKKLLTPSFRILEITKKSYHIMANEMAALKLQMYKPDILIKPDLSKMGWIDFDKGEYAMKQGEIATQGKIKEIRRILKKR